MEQILNYRKKYSLSLQKLKEQIEAASPGFTITTAHISYIERGQRSISPEIAYRLDKASNGEINKVKLVFSPENISKWEEELNQVGNSCNPARAA